MAAAARTADSAVGRPAAPLAPLVRRYLGYRFSGFPAGVHLGLPSRHLTVVVSLGPPTAMGTSPTGRAVASAYVALAAGLCARPAYVVHDGTQYGVQLELTPLGARRLLGVPAGELADSVADLDAFLGPDAVELAERMAEAPGWPERFAVLDDVLARRTDRLDAAEAWLAHVWDRLVASRGAVRVGALASETGWSRRHLAARFAREYGLTPKEAARVVRFERSVRTLRAGLGQRTLADVAAACGYYDQAHLTREWRELAGVPPSVWLATEVLPSVQDGGGADEATSPHD